MPPGNKPVLMKKPVVTARVLNINHPPETSVKPETLVKPDKPIIRPAPVFTVPPGSKNILSELKRRQASIKKQGPQLLTDHNGAIFRLIPFTPPPSTGKPAKPASIQQQNSVELPAISYDKCDGCCQTNGTSSAETSIVRQTGDVPGADRESDRM